MIISNNPNATKRLLNKELSVTKNKLIIVIIAGKRPLQGIKLLVNMAKRRIFLSPIILELVTPIALQPSPIHIVKLCLPQEPHFLKGLSILNAILGNRP